MANLPPINGSFDYASLEWRPRFEKATDPATKTGLLLQWILIRLRYNAAPFRLAEIRRNGPHIHLLLDEPPAGDDRILAPCEIDAGDYPRGVLDAALLHNSSIESVMYLKPLVEQFFASKLCCLCKGSTFFWSQ
jgi:hypothetical protein